MRCVHINMSFYKFGIMIMIIILRIAYAEYRESRHWSKRLAGISVWVYGCVWHHAYQLISVDACKSLCIHYYFHYYYHRIRVIVARSHKNCNCIRTRNSKLNEMIIMKYFSLLLLLHLLVRHVTKEKVELAGNQNRWCWRSRSSLFVISMSLFFPHLVFVCRCRSVLAGPFCDMRSLM